MRGPHPLTPSECEERGIPCGIWQGRFQCVHNGHYHIYNCVLPRFQRQMIAIVNPSPSNPPDDTFIKFGEVTNPLNYFQRMLLWKSIVDADNRSVSFFPCWHARKSVELENYFLPTHTRLDPERCWIVPLDQNDNEVEKALQLEGHGEIICDDTRAWEDESIDDKGLSASEIRRCIVRGDYDRIRERIPASAYDITLELYNDTDPNTYQIVPCIGDKIDFTSLYYAVNWAKEHSLRYVVIAITVSVASKEDWWFSPAEPLDNWRMNYYGKMTELEAIFKALGFRQYLITPIFMQKKGFQRLWRYSSDFLPKKADSIWVINQDCQYEDQFDLFNMVGTNRITIENTGNLVSAEGYSAFIQSRIMPFAAVETVETEALAVLEEIKRKIRTYKASADEDLQRVAFRFKDTPAQIEELIRKLRYSCISCDNFVTQINSLKAIWDKR